jgi:hypothetical protein
MTHELKWWGSTGVTRDNARFILIRLPSWGYGYSINCDEERWGQRCLFYHGHRGFSLMWIFPQD